MDRNEKDLETRGIDNSLEGKAKNLKGRVKDAAGSLTGDRQMEAEGKWDQVKGKVQDKVGEAQRRIDRSTRDDEV